MAELRVLVVDDELPILEELRLFPWSEHGYRPLLSGELFGAFGWYGLDGALTDRSRMVSSLAAELNAPALSGLFDARPVTGEVAIPILPEAQTAGMVLTGIERSYAHYYGDSIRGAFELFLDAGIQADLIELDNLAKYRVAYLAMPVALSETSIARVVEWVEQGGNLICEGLPGFFTDRGIVRTAQPDDALGALLGATQRDYSFAAESLRSIEVSTAWPDSSGVFRAGLYRQSYQPCDGGSTIGRYDDGSVAVVANRYGKGQTVLIGSMPAFVYLRERDVSTLRYFQRVAAELGGPQRITASVPLIVRAWRGNDRWYLWIVNSAPDVVSGSLQFSEWFGACAWRAVRMPTGSDCADLGGNRVTVTVPGRDTIVITGNTGEEK